MNLLIFILVCYGACNNLVYGSLFEGWRNFLTKFGTGGYSIHKLFTCMMCLPTWMGFAISTILIYSGLGSYLPINASAPILVIIFLHGLLSTGAVWLLHTLQEKLER